MNVAIQRPQLLLTEIELLGWLGQASPGDTLEYHRGFLALDLHPQATRLAQRKRAALALVAARAWWASEQRLVHLVQRRHGPNDASYIAIARPQRDGFSLSTLIAQETA